jgi:hypothetical protein
MIGHVDTGLYGELIFRGFFVVPQALVDAAPSLALDAHARWLVVVLIRHEYMHHNLRPTIASLAKECGELRLATKLRLDLLCDSGLLVLDPPLSVLASDTPFRFDLTPIWEKLAIATDSES